MPIVNSKTYFSSYGSGCNGKPHSKRSGPSGENHRMPKPVLVRTDSSDDRLKQGDTTLGNWGAGVV